jgi:acetate---CoA ligase (ADP-forming)
MPDAGQGAPAGSFGALTALLAPRSVAVIGASDRDGNLGGLATRFLGKFGYTGPVWPVNAGRRTVADLPCFPDLAALPGIPDLAIVAVPADAVEGVLRDCVAAHVPAAIVWAGGFAELGEEGRQRQHALEDAVRGSDLLLCGPNCIGVINTSIGLTASFSSLMTELDSFTPGAVSMVSQSGGIAVTAHARAQELGLGFRVTISCGNEATLGIPDFIRALAQDDGTKVIAVYTEGLSDPSGFLDALAEARRRGKPVVILKGGATEASGRAALAHTGRLAGSDRTYDAIFREFAAIRVNSTEEMLDVCLQLAALPAGQLPAGNRILLSSFGGGSGVIGTDQCVREGLVVEPLDSDTRARLVPILTELGSSLNPVDLTPGSVTNPKNRANLPEVLRTLIAAPGVDAMLFLCAGFGHLAPDVAAMFEALRDATGKPIYLSWLSPPPGIAEGLAAKGIIAFNEHARAIRAAGHIARYSENMRHRIACRPELARAFSWQDFIAPGTDVVSEDLVSRILEAAGLPVARGRIARTEAEAVGAAAEVGFPVAIKAISPTITHRAAVGLVALNIDTPEGVVRTDQAFRARAAALGATLDGLWVQHMVAEGHELLVTALRDREFGVMVGCGMGGGQTEIIDDVVFTRAPIDAQGAGDLLGRLRTLRRLPELIAAERLREAAAFIAAFSALVAGAPWDDFTLEINPLKLGANGAIAVDGLLLLPTSVVNVVD